MRKALAAPQNAESANAHFVSINLRVIFSASSRHFCAVKTSIATSFLRLWLHFFLRPGSCTIHLRISLAIYLFVRSSVRTCEVARQLSKHGDAMGRYHCLFLFRFLCFAIERVTTHSNNHGYAATDRCKLLCIVFVFVPPFFRSFSQFQMLFIYPKVYTFAIANVDATKKSKQTNGLCALFVWINTQFL